MSQASNEASAASADQVVAPPRRELVSNVVVLLLAAGAIAMTPGFPTHARIIPRIVLAPLIALSVLGIVRYVRAKRAAAAAGNWAEIRGLDGRELAAIAWTIGYGLAFIFLGFTVSTALFMVVFLRFYGRHSWLRALLMPAAIIAFVYLVLENLLLMPVYRGFLPF